MVGVGGIQTVQNPLFGVGLAIAIGIAEEYQIRRLHDQHSVLVKLEAGGTIQAIGKGGAFHRLAGFGIEIEDQEFVEYLGGRHRLGIRRPGRDPQSALGIEVHLHRIDQFGEVFLRGDQFNPATIRVLDQLDGFVGIDIRHRIFAVRRCEVHRRQVVVGNGEIKTFGKRPNQLVAVFGFDIALRHFLAENFCVGHALVGDAGSISIDVELVDGAIAMVPFGVFQQDRLADFHHRLVSRGGWLFAENRLELHRGEQFVTFLF